LKYAEWQQGKGSSTPNRQRMFHSRTFLLVIGRVFVVVIGKLNAGAIRPHHDPDRQCLLLPHFVNTKPLIVL
jgi:hypothetical protein